MPVGLQSGHYEKLGSTSISPKSYWRSVNRARSVVLAVLMVLSFTTWYLYSWDFSGHDESDSRLSSPGGSGTWPKNAKSTSKPKRIVLMPLTSPDEHFCRSLFTLLINGYPTPIILGWNMDIPHIYYDLKIETFNQWIHTSEGDDSDIIVMLDGRDVYAQLPADAFFSQFETHQSEPNIVVGAEKNCYPGPRSVARCAELPESPLPSDVYGDLTDQDQPHHPSVFHPGPLPGDPSTWEYGRIETWRPRYINAGTMVGRRSDLKKLSDEMAMHSRLVLSGAMSVRISGDDQELLGIINLGHILLKGIGLVLPDMLTRFFQVVTFAYRDLEVRSFEEILPAVRDVQQSALHNLLAEDETWRHGSVIWNRISKTVPTFFHFPGCKAPAKTEPYYTNMWFMKVDGIGGTNSSQEKQRPAERFLRHIQAHTDERFGYGVRLDDGKWIGFMDMCSSYASKILATDDDWIENPGEPCNEYGEA